MREHTQRLAECADKAGSATPVPTCPDWTVTTLVEHVGQTHHWVLEIVERRITDPEWFALVLTRRLPLTDGDADHVSVDGDIDLARHWLQHTAHISD